jgi:hypothetical protein
MNRFVFGRGWVFEDEATDGTEGGAGGAGGGARLREMATARAMERVTTSTLVAKLAVRQLLQAQRRRRKRRRT